MKVKSLNDALPKTGKFQKLLAMLTLVAGVLTTGEMAPASANEANELLGACPYNVSSIKRNLNRDIKNVINPLFPTAPDLSTLGVRLEIAKRVIQDPRCKRGKIELQPLVSIGERSLSIGQSRLTDMLDAAENIQRSTIRIWD